MERSDLPWLVDGARAAHKQLEATLSGLEELQVRQPSRLPNWSRGHLLTHVARNADSHVRLLKAAQRGKLVEQYKGGQEGRAADIELGAIRDAATIIKDTVRASTRLIALWTALPDDVWERDVGTNVGTKPAWGLVWSRWRELAIHHVDLDLGYGPSDWPGEFVGHMLQDILQGLPSRLPTGLDGLTLQVTGANDALLSSHSVTSDAQQRQNASSAEQRGASVTAKGSAPMLLAWLLGRQAATPAPEFLDPQGHTIPAPTLAPWL